MLIRLVTLIGLLFGVQDLQASEWGDTERRREVKLSIFMPGVGRLRLINILSGGARLLRNEVVSR